MIHPWIVFITFSVVNAMLAYGPFSILTDLWIGFWGWLVPLGILMRYGFKGQEAVLPGADQERPPKRSSFFWIVLGVAFAVRFVGLTHFLDFPIFDELVNSFYAVHLDHHWDWYPFFHWSQMPPLYIWALAGIFKVFGYSFAALWSLPAFLSLVSLIPLYAAVRRSFGPRVALVVLGLMAVNFWPLFIAKFSHQVNLMVLVESLTLYFFSRFYQASGRGEEGGWTVPLGICLGLGFYTYFAWPLVLFLILGTVAYGAYRGGRGKRRSLLMILVVMGLTVLPLAVPALFHGYGNYIKTLMIGHSNPDNDIDWDFSQDFLYFTTFFWQGLKRHFAYNPWWGGFLNPLMGSFFFLGFLCLWGSRKNGLVRWVLASLLALFVPILFANNTNWFHVAPLLPFFMFVAAMGVLFLWDQTRPSIRGAAFPAVLAVSCLLDFNNLFLTREYLNGNQISREYRQIHQFVREKTEKDGPGLLFTHFNVPCYDIQLWMVLHPFDAIPDLAPGKLDASWAAAYLTFRERPIVDGLCQGVRWIPLRVGQQTIQSPLLALIPMTPKNKPVLERWVAGERIVEDLIFQDLDRPTNFSREDLIQRILDSKPILTKDPILALCFWELLEKFLMSDGQYPMALKARIEGFKTRIVAIPMDYYQLGKLYMKLGQFSSALACFQQAGRMNADFQLPPDKLSLLQRAIEGRRKSHLPSPPLPGP